MEQTFNTPIQSLKDVDRTKPVQFKQIFSDALIKMKKYNEAYTMIGPGLSKSGLPATGLTEDRQYRDAKGKIQNIIGTRKEMERELDMTEGSLKPKSVFWLTFNVRVDSDTRTLDLQDPQDLLIYLFLYAQSIVANSLKEIETNSKAEYVLFSEEQEAAIKVKARRSLKEAYKVSMELDLETKINILSIKGYNADATSPASIDNKLDEIAEEDPAAFLELVEDSNLVYKSLITKVLDKGILTIKDGAIHHGEVIIGIDVEEAAKSVANNKKLEKILKAKLSGDLDLLKESLESDYK